MAFDAIETTVANALLLKAQLGENEPVYLKTKPFSELDGYTRRLKETLTLSSLLQEPLGKHFFREFLDSKDKESMLEICSEIRHFRSSNGKSKRRRGRLIIESLRGKSQDGDIKSSLEKASKLPEDGDNSVNNGTDPPDVPNAKVNESVDNLCCEFCVLTSMCFTQEKATSPENDISGAAVNPPKEGNGEVNKAVEASEKKAVASSDDKLAPEPATDGDENFDAVVPVVTPSNVTVPVTVDTVEVKASADGDANEEQVKVATPTEAVKDADDVDKNAEDGTKDEAKAQDKKQDADPVHCPIDLSMKSTHRHLIF